MILCYIVAAITYSLNPMTPGLQVPILYFTIRNGGLTIIPIDPAYDLSTPYLYFDRSDIFGADISTFSVLFII
jgi:hypothetical protein